MRIDIRLTAGVAAALLAGGCGGPDRDPTAATDTRICTDRQGNRVSDDQCRPTSASHGGGVSPFLWYYLGRSSAIPYYGERVVGGSYAPSTGTSYARAPAESAMSRSSAISRGGFGSSARGGGFGGAGE